MSLKALAHAVLERSSTCNKRATAGESPCNSSSATEHRLLRKPTDETAELMRLVRQCGQLYNFTEAEHREALEIALADPESALTCFRAIASEHGI